MNDLLVNGTLMLLALLVVIGLGVGAYLFCPNVNRATKKRGASPIRRLARA